QKERDASEHRGEHSGAPPIEPFTLIERSVQHRESCAGIEKTRKARCRGGFLSGRSRRYPVIDTEHHQRRNPRRIPEHPVPGKMLSVPSIKGWSDVHGSIDKRRVEGNREGKEARRNVPQRERERERVEGAGG